jgi:hypothetical protein
MKDVKCFEIKLNVRISNEKKLKKSQNCKKKLNDEKKIDQNLKLLQFQREKNEGLIIGMFYIGFF